MTSKDTYMVIVRHGATRYTEAGCLCGGSDEIDPELSEAGLKQINGAASLATHFGRDVIERMPIPEVLYGSPVKRAHQLACLLSEKLNLPLQTVEPLREIGVGEAFGKPMDEILKLYPQAIDDWIDGKPAWETLEHVDSMTDRLVPFANKIWEEHAGQTVVLACHEVITRVLLGTQLKIPGRELMRMDIPLASTTILRRDSRGKIFLVALALDCSLGHALGDFHE
ncbi:histidine phosphatase family protein [Actinomycetaceae bacterium TAE3-ERU4]|nr:histidine phosphatase family protein [Actinomycetaceae bacterium TAE3-ERU4]